jgi:hypothetical protein
VPEKNRMDADGTLEIAKFSDLGVLLLRQLALSRS